MQEIGSGNKWVKTIWAAKTNWTILASFDLVSADKDQS